MSILDTAKPAQGGGPIHALLYGPPGVGKTYAIRTLPTTHDRILVLACEPGARSISDTEIPTLPVTSSDTLRQVIRALRDTPDRYDWIVVDSVSALAETVLTEALEASKDPRPAYGAMAGSVRRAVAALTAIAPNSLWIARQDQDIDSETGRITRRYPSFPGKLLSLRRPVAHDFDLLLAMHAKKRGDRVERLIQTSAIADPTTDAKVRDPNGVLQAWEPADLAAIVAKLAT